MKRFRRLAPLLAAPVALAALAMSARAQSLMVGADGAVHIDGMSGEEITAADPIVIEQQPELVGPGAQPMMMQPGMMGAQSEFVGMPGMTPGMMPAGPMYAGQNYNGANCGEVCAMPLAACMPVTIVSPRPIRHAIFGEFLFLHPTGADVTHAQQQNGTGGAGTVPFGTIGATDLHYEPGVRVGGDLAVSQCTSIAATYTYFESNASSRIIAPVVPGGGGAVGSLVQHPGAALIASAGPLDGRSVVDFQMADADYRALLLNDKCFWLNGSAGLRWGQLEQEFGQVGVFGGSQAGNIITQSNITFDGGGPKFGLDGGRVLGKRGFSIYARAGVSPLAGQFNSRYSMNNDTTAVQLAQANWDNDRIMTILDYEIGLAWTGPQRRWRFATGYTAAYWYNAVTTQEFVGAVQSGDYSDVSHTIRFDGLTARIERMW